MATRASIIISGCGMTPARSQKCWSISKMKMRTDTKLCLRSRRSRAGIKGDYRPYSAARRISTLCEKRLSLSSYFRTSCEYAIYQRQSVLSEEWDEWTTLLDANKRAAHSEFYSLGGLAISPDNTIMALAEDYLSRRQYGIRFRNLQMVTGIQNCSTMWHRNLSGPMTRSLFIMCENIPPHFCLIRFGGITLARHSLTMSLSMKRKTTRFMSVCTKPHQNIMW